MPIWKPTSIIWKVIFEYNLIRVFKKRREFLLIMNVFS